MNLDYAQWVARRTKSVYVPDFVILYNFATKDMSDRHRMENYPVPPRMEDWMIPLIKQYHRLDAYTGYGYSEAGDELRRAYLAGYKGDMDYLDNYLGGLELARAPIDSKQLPIDFHQ